MRELSAEDFANAAGKTPEPSSWIEITQERINRFADATGDHQYIHVDPERAASGPFGKTIAHGFLTLSMLVEMLMENTIVPKGLATTVNYGSDKIRYLSPVPVDSRIRAHQTIREVTEKQPGAWLVKLDVSVEIEGVDKPALVAEVLLMHITG